MIRIVLINLLLLLLPFIIYFIYVYLFMKVTGEYPARTTPVLVLFATGVMLMIGAVLYFIQFSGGKPGQIYSPPVLENGEIRPGKLQ